MYNKLTLNIEQTVIENAKIYAKNQKRSISKLVEEYLSAISLQNNKANENSEYVSLGPITKELAGIIKTKKDVTYKDILTEALMEKYL
jgi:uncharacterized protein Veg